MQVFSLRSWGVYTDAVLIHSAISFYVFCVRERLPSSHLACTIDSLQGALIRRWRNTRALHVLSLFRPSRCSCLPISRPFTCVSSFWTACVGAAYGRTPSSNPCPMSCRSYLSDAWLRRDARRHHTHCDHILGSSIRCELDNAFHAVRSELFTEDAPTVISW